VRGKKEEISRKGEKMNNTSCSHGEKGEKRVKKNRGVSGNEKKKKKLLAEIRGKGREKGKKKKKGKKDLGVYRIPFWLGGKGLKCVYFLGGRRCRPEKKKTKIL